LRELFVCLPSGDSAIGARLCTAGENAVLVAPDDLAASHGQVADGALNVVAFAFEGFGNGVGEQVLDLDGFIFGPLPTRSIKRGLRIESEINSIHHHLHVSLRLDESTHDAEGPDGLTVLGQEPRNNRVIRFFARFESVGMGRIKGEIAAAVVQCNAGAGNDEAGPEAHVVALDIGNHVAFTVCGRQIDCAAFRGRTGYRGKRLRADEFAAFGCVGIGE